MLAVRKVFRIICDGLHTMLAGFLGHLGMVVCCTIIVGTQVNHDLGGESAMLVVCTACVFTILSLSTNTGDLHLWISSKAEDYLANRDKYGDSLRPYFEKQEYAPRKSVNGNADCSEDRSASSRRQSGLRVCMVDDKPVVFYDFNVLQRKDAALECAYDSPAIGSESDNGKGSEATTKIEGRTALQEVAIDLDFDSSISTLHE
ncbi:hypothetical protein FVE85_3907 [Porphyridium purpureum]|uniref:Uncharacterized protein n=1 Tax=Porphyridium purpureum TaxID=35688 RepID=A0A5J4YSV9_PORPP|nr:hypothetical protein FVE85_3907 [Porphyridium purpureum]|eukprot:POR0292..scf229_5